MNKKQIDYLNGFFSHCYHAYQDGGQLDSVLWAKQLDDLSIPWFIQNCVSELAEKRENRFFYFKSILDGVINDYDQAPRNAAKHLYILKSDTGAYYTGLSGAFICSGDIQKALLMTKEKADFLKATNNYFLGFEVCTLDNIKITEEINHLNSSHWFIVMTKDGEEVSETYSSLAEAKNEFKRLLAA